jgi:hypothetical protein
VGGPKEAPTEQRLRTRQFVATFSCAGPEVGERLLIKIKYDAAHKTYDALQIEAAPALSIAWPALIYAISEYASPFGVLYKHDVSGSYR